jgi:hypothetical protein
MTCDDDLKKLFSSPVFDEGMATALRLAISSQISGNELYYRDKVPKEYRNPPHEPQKKIKDWPCPVCTFLNKSGSIKCSMCGGNRPEDVKAEDSKTAGKTVADYVREYIMGRGAGRMVDIMAFAIIFSCKLKVVDERTQKSIEIGVSPPTIATLFLRKTDTADRQYNLLYEQEPLFKSLSHVFSQPQSPKGQPDSTFPPQSADGKDANKTPKETATKSTPTRESKQGEEKIPIVWPCSICTYLNKVKHRKCRMCGQGRRPEGLRRRRRASMAAAKCTSLPAMEGYIPPLARKKSSLTLEVGGFVDCRDKFGKWCEAEILDINNSRVLVHYLAWASKWDETINIDTEMFRFTNFHSHSPQASPEETKLCEQLSLGDEMWIYRFKPAPFRWIRAIIGKIVPPYLRFEYMAGDDFYKYWYHVRSGEFSENDPNILDTNSKTSAHANVKPGEMQPQSENITEKEKAEDSGESQGETEGVGKHSKKPSSLLVSPLTSASEALASPTMANSFVSCHYERKHIFVA